MCGIAGILGAPSGEPVAREPLCRMIGALHHRGPDEHGLYRDRRVGLGHARLSIIDVAGGRQPLANQDETLWIVFNGEIYNYLELRAELEGLGHRFRTRSDTEVVVHAWEEWQEAAFPRLNGQWALALWDARRERLVLCRDRLGIRPLYHAEHGGRLLFASEVKALFAAAPDLPRELDPHGLDQTFTLWSTVPPQTVFRGVAELEPGHLRIYEAGRVRDRSYWQPRFPQGRDAGFGGTLEAAVAEVRSQLEQATSLRMLRADVPVGSYLSGGLDSSLVASMALAAKGSGFHTFSLRFEEDEYDEGGYQQVMADRLGSAHHELRVTRGDIADAFPQVIAHTERPVLRTAPAPLYLLSRMVRDAGIKVVLTGEGADEVFAGYDLFREGSIRRFWARYPSSTWRPRLLERLYPYLARSPVRQQAMARQFFGRDLHRHREPGFAHQTRWQTTRALQRLFAPQLRAAIEGRDPGAELCASLPPEAGHWSALAQDQYLEMRTLLAGYILSSQGDRMLMAHSVEGRFPFLDRDLVELAASLPDRCKLRGLDEKHIIKRAASDLVPPAIVGRTKQPYRAPDALAFTGDAAPDWVAHALSARSVASAGVFDPKAVELLWNKCSARAAGGQLSNTDNMGLVGVLSVQLLHDAMIRRNPEPRPIERLTVDVDRVSR